MGSLYSGQDSVSTEKYFRKNYGEQKKIYNMYFNPLLMFSYDKPEYL